MTLPGVEAIRPTAKWPPRSALPASTPECVDTLVNRDMRRGSSTDTLPPHPARASDTCSTSRIMRWARRSAVRLDIYQVFFPRMPVPVTSGIPLDRRLGRRGSGNFVGVVLLLYLTNRRIIHVVDTQIVAIGRIYPVGVASCSSFCVVAQRHARGKRNLRLSRGGCFAIEARFDAACYRSGTALRACSNREIRRQLTVEFNACILNGVCCVPQIGLSGGIPRRLAHLQINRHANRCKNANDNHDNKQLNESKTRLPRGTPPTGPIHTTHGFTSLSSCKPAIGPVE